jgi:hypothetical protein
MSDITSAAAAFEALLPKHAASLTICHNDHKGVYETVAQTVEYDEHDPNTSRYTWRNDGEKQEAIATNEMWYCQWYPDTPIGFHCFAAPTLAKLLAFMASDA